MKERETVAISFDDGVLDDQYQCNLCLFKYYISTADKKMPELLYSNRNNQRALFSTWTIIHTWIKKSSFFFFFSKIHCS
jgi:hypothetical protein